jgi:hypothetical protein
MRPYLIALSSANVGLGVAQYITRMRRGDTIGAGINVLVAGLNAGLFLFECFVLK